MIYSEKRESSHSFNFVCCEGGESERVQTVTAWTARKMNCVTVLMAVELIAFETRWRLVVHDGENIWRQIIGMRRERGESSSTESVRS